MSEKEQPRVLIAAPTYGEIADRLYENMGYVASHAIEQGVKVIGGHLTFMYWIRGSSIPTNRNLILDLAQKVKADYCLMVDSDMCEIPKEALVRLLSHEKSFVGALYFGKQPPFVPIASRRANDGHYTSIVDFEKEEPHNGLLQVDGMGFGLVLISMSMLEAIDKIRNGRPRFRMQDNKGEDYYFCELVKEAGYSVYVDVELSIGHRGMYTYGVNDFTRFKPGLDKMRQEHGRSTRDAIASITREFNTW